MVEVRGRVVRNEDRSVMMVRKEDRRWRRSVEEVVWVREVRDERDRRRSRMDERSDVKEVRWMIIDRRVREVEFKRWEGRDGWVKGRIGVRDGEDVRVRE